MGIELTSDEDPILCRFCVFLSNLIHPFIVVGLSFSNKYRGRKCW